MESELPPESESMTGHDNFHSTAVAWLKIALPLLALAILSTLFLVSRTINPDDAIPYAEVDVQDRVREPRLTAPTWAGVLDDGAALSVKADVARPETATSGASAETISAQLQTPDGAQVDMVAARGEMNDATQMLTIQGGVVITTSTGYRINSEEVTSALNRTLVISEGPITATGPLGRIDAGRMEISESDRVAGAYLLVFKNGVKLLYQP